MEFNGNSEGRGLQKEKISKGVGGCWQRFFPGGLSKIGELLINDSFSVEQAISYFTVTGVSKQVLLVCIHHLLSRVGLHDSFL